MNKAVGYYRVSTHYQEQHGSGLDSQRHFVHEYIQQRHLQLVAEFTEVESGRKIDRPQLQAAIAKAKQESAVLIIASLDRLSRNAAFTMTLHKSGVNFVAADMPGANSLTIGIMALVAQDESERHSQRIKRAMALAKQRGARFGCAANLTEEAKLKGPLSVHNQAVEHYKLISGYIQLLRQQNYSFQKIANQLNAEGHVTLRGKPFSAMQVFRIVQRLTHPPHCAQLAKQKQKVE